MSLGMFKHTYYIFPHRDSGQISIIPKPELRGFWGSSLIKPPFRVTSADVVIISPRGFLDTRKGNIFFLLEHLLPEQTGPVCDIFRLSSTR